MSDARTKVIYSYYQMHWTTSYSTKAEKVTFSLLLVIQVVIIWSLPVFITQDGPSHLYNANLLTELLQGDSLALRFHEINLDTFPNWFSTIILGLLQFVFSPLIAEKIFISILIVSLALSFRFALKCIQSSSVYLSSFIFTFTYGYHLFFGFYNFLWGIVFLLLLIAWHQSQSLDSHRQGLPSFFILLLLYFCHPVPFVFAIIFILVQSSTINKNLFSLSHFKSVAKNLLLVAAPTLLFLLFFISRQSSDSSIWQDKWDIEQLTLLRELSILQSFSIEELPALSLVFYVMLLVLLHALYRFIQNPNRLKGLGLLFVFLTAIFLFFNGNEAMAGGSKLEGRLMIFICLLTILFSAQASPIKGFKELCMILLLVIYAMIVPIRYQAHLPCAQRARQVVESVKNLSPGEIILPTNCSSYGELDEQTTLSPFLRIFKHVGCYAGCKTGSIVLDNYEANTTYFPVKWKESKNPYKNLSVGNEGGMEENPPNIDIANYELRSQEKITSIIQIGNCDRFAHHQNMISLDSNLNRDFEIKKEFEFVKLFLRKNRQNKKAAF